MGSGWATIRKSPYAESVLLPIVDGGRAMAGSSSDRRCGSSPWPCLECNLLVPRGQASTNVLVREQRSAGRGPYCVASSPCKQHETQSSRSRAQGKSACELTGTECGGEKAEGRRQKAEGRRQRAEGRGQRAEGSWRAGLPRFGAAGGSSLMTVSGAAEPSDVSGARRILLGWGLARRRSLAVAGMQPAFEARADLNCPAQSLT